MKNKIFKNFLLLVMISLLLGSSIFAVDASVRFTDDHLIIFAPGSFTSQSDMFPDFKGVMPGDKLSQEIGIKNEAEDFDYIRVYLQALPHDEVDNPLSPNVQAAGETVASMEEFLSQLMMSVYNEGVLVYQDSPDQPGTLADSLLLGQLPFGASLNLRVELEVPMSLSSDYMNRVGEVDWLIIVEGFEKIPPTNLTVSKIWKDDGKERPESIKVNLLKDGVLEEGIELNENNQWTYAWIDLDGLVTWSIEEIDVPQGYKVSYSKQDETVIITNTKEIEPPEEVEPVDVNVKKVWTDKKHPSSVKVTLFNGDKAIEKIILNDANNWYYSWKDLDGKGNWRVLEIDIPKTYKPNYSKKGDLIIITNIKTLPSTGASAVIHYPLIGSVLLVLGVFFSKKKSKYL